MQRCRVPAEVPLPLDAASSILTSSSGMSPGNPHNSLALNTQREELVPIPPIQNNLPMFGNKRQKYVPAGVTSSMLSCLQPVTRQHSHNTRGKQMALINLHRKYALMRAPRSRCCGRQPYLPHTQHHSPNSSPERGTAAPWPCSGSSWSLSQRHRSGSAASRAICSPLPTAVSKRPPQAPKRGKLHPKLLEAARLQAACTQHMSQSKQIAWNFPERAEDAELPAGRGTRVCSPGARSC